MMRGIGILAAAAAMVLATGALAAEPEAQEASKEKKVCKSEKMTGSLTRVRRICMTQKQWDELALSTQRGLDDLARDANRAQADLTRVAPAGPGGP